MVAKFELKLRQRDIPDEELRRDLIRVAEKLDARTVTKATYDEHGNFGATTFMRRFKTWNKALEYAGLDLSNRVNVPDEELLENLAHVWQALGRQPVGNDISKVGLSAFSLGTYEKRYGSWNKALLAFIRFVEGRDDDVNLRSSEKQLTSDRTPRKINWRLRAQILIRDNCICQMCGASPAKNSDVILHVDHKMPWSKNGETVIENLQTLCSICNIGKGNEIFFDDP